LEIVNESKRHSRGDETHFNVLIVSERFKGLSKVKQHQLVYSEVSDLMKEIHALTLTCHSEQPENTEAWSLGCFHKKK
jgi:BolA protein